MAAYMRVIAAIFVTFGAGLVGSLFIDTNIGGWYEDLSKPVLTPTDTSFLAVWIVLYFLMAIALSIVWLKNPQTETTETWVRFYFVQLLFNAMWTMFFFGLHAMLLAFLDILVLAFIIMTLLAQATKIDGRAAWLLAPYMAWLLFAAYLDIGMWFLN